MSFAAMMLIGMAIDVVLGWPDRIHAWIGHPVTWLGRATSVLETRWNQGSERRRLRMGALTTGVIVLLALVPAATMQMLLSDGAIGWLVGGVLAWPLIALRSMHDHVAAVARPLERGDLDGARRAVAMIVGRDPATLDTAGVARASIESLAENTSDGIIAPVFWGVVGGLPGIAAYKAINTLDSMIGHRNERFEAFGRVAARLDDVVNVIPARLTGVLFAIAGPRNAMRSCRVMVRDAHRHRSPNAGWPEAAMAGALGLRLSGPRAYGMTLSAEAWLNAGAPDPGPKDLGRALSLYRRVMAILALAVGAICLL